MNIVLYIALRLSILKPQYL